MTDHLFEEGWDARQLLEHDFPPQEWLIDSLLPVGLTFLISRSKTGKSWMMQTFAMACGYEKGVALGAHYDVTPCGVLYLDLELAPRGSQKRIQKIMNFHAANGHESEIPILFYGINRWPKIDGGGLRKIEKTLDDRPETRLVVIDTIAKIWPANMQSGGRNAYYVEYDLLSRLKRIADERNVAIVCLHHQNKSDAVDPLDKASGTAALPAVADAIWMLERPRGGEDPETRTATLFVTGREVRERTIDLKWDNHAGWVMTNDPLIQEEETEERNFYA